MRRFVKLECANKGTVFVNPEGVAFLAVGHSGTYAHLFNGDYVTDPRPIEEIAQLMSDVNIIEEP